MVPKYPRIFRNRFRFILVPKYSTTPGHNSEALVRNSLVALINFVTQVYRFKTRIGLVRLVEQVTNPY